MSSDPRPIKGKGAYHLIPTVSRGWPPSGWVDTSRITGPSVRRITPGYISQRLPRTNTIAMNQAYIRKIITNPRTPECNREAAIRYVLDNPDKFTLRLIDTGDSFFDDYNRNRNDGADPLFVFRIRNLMKRKN